MASPALFKWRHFLPEIIVLNVQWYCRYALSYRDLEEMMDQRGHLNRNLRFWLEILPHRTFTSREGDR